MLSLLLLLSGLGRLTSAGQHSETSLLQITVPQKTGTNTSDGGGSETHVTYVIKIDRKTYTFHLEKQSFLDSHFVVYSYKSGTLYPESSFVKGHCFYQGYATEIANSVVTLSTCSGLRGLLQLENVSYGIEPLESSSTYEHMLYQIKDNKIDISPVAENYSASQWAHESYKILVKSEKNSDVLLKRVLKIQVIMDKALYDYMGSEVALASGKVVYIFSLINTMYSQLKVSVTLTSLELWSDQNKISTNGDANEVLQRFVSWREKFLFQRSHDMAYLLIYRDHPNYVGATYHGMACDPKFAAGIALHPKMITLEAFSVVMAQLIGINLGLTYSDDVYNCYCPGTTCIMHPEAIRSRGVKFFSSCSMDQFKRTASQPEFECLQNRTKVSKVVPQGRSSTCGNGVLEPPEQCDCGVAEHCTHKKCCDASSCTLIGDAECGSGPCCDKRSCLITDRGAVCRKSTDLCDFTEYCNGISEFCVPDVKSADLELCNNKTAFCYQGVCQDTDKQCAELFGKFSKGASALCSQEVNMHTDDFGNCLGRFCSFRHIYCGKLVCVWTRAEIVPFKNFDTQYTFLEGTVCLSARLRNSTAVNMQTDYTYTANGTMCGPNQYCNRGSCVAVTVDTNSTCNSSIKCNGHGVCNTLQNCHCDAGYAPPQCEATPSSPGGSINDGFWAVSGKTTDMLARRRRASRRNGLVISFYVFLPFLILIAIVALKWNKMKILRNKEDTISGGSLSEDSSHNSSQLYS
ncbi:A disintegrin and metallopeptidase domain 3-like [Hippopotamus amphibius kiboko]|uniref:A disintegrin and metallopeptidase domain 3-like n=1 Tax=Hippopotamus amphibius kiboko TaxID=575201 RepID=UPI002591FEB8|nr:A disintegrin and metallopeptidase domain 3-like [Hippopotamus amphibius kiboko]